MLLPTPQPEWEFLTKTIYDPEVFWVMVSAVASTVLVGATVALVWVGLLPLLRARKADLAEKLRQPLLTPSAQKIFFLAANGMLRFVIHKQPPEEDIPYFEIIRLHPTILQQRLDEIVGDQRIVMSFEMEDQLLSPLGEVAYFEAEKSIEYEDVWRLFTAHIEFCLSNPEITKYIQWRRETYNPAVYRKLEKLQKELRKHSEQAFRAASKELESDKAKAG